MFRILHFWTSFNPVIDRHCNTHWAVLSGALLLLYVPFIILRGSWDVLPNHFLWTYITPFSNHEEVRPCRRASDGCFLSLAPSPPSCSAYYSSCLPWGEQLSSPVLFPLWWFCLEPANQRMKLLKRWSKLNLSFLSSSLSSLSSLSPSFCSLYIYSDTAVVKWLQAWTFWYSQSKVWKKKTVLCVHNFAQWPHSTSDMEKPVQAKMSRMLHLPTDIKRWGFDLRATLTQTTHSAPVSALEHTSLCFVFCALFV